MTPALMLMQIDCGLCHALSWLAGRDCGNDTEEWRARVHPEDLVRLEKIRRVSLPRTVGRI